MARELYAAAKAKGVGFLDAPVSGGQAGAENGQLTVMVGGDAAAFDKAKPVIDAYAKMVGLMGPAGAGQLTKMVNQICIAGLVQGLAEGIHFAKRAGLDVEKVIDVISKGAAQSWQMENRYKTMNAGKFDFGFAVDWMRKDLAHLPRRGARQRREAAGHRAGRSVLRRGAGDGRQALGHVEPDRAAGAGLMAKSSTQPPAAEADHRRTAGARLGEEPRRHGALRHQHRAGLRHFDGERCGRSRRRIKRDHELAAALWATGYHEARLLAALIDDPKQVTREADGLPGRRISTRGTSATRPA